MDDEHRDQYALVMPFLPVASRGGPHDDDAYVAGYEMGQLDAWLRIAEVRRTERTIRSDNRAQADLLAMRHGWQATFTELDADGWVGAEFVRVTRNGRDLPGVAG